MILWAEGFDDGAIRGTRFGVYPTVEPTSARTGINGLRCQASSASFTNTYYGVSIPNTVTGFCHFAVKMDALYPASPSYVYHNQPVYAPSGAFLTLYGGLNRHLELAIRSDGRFEVYNAAGYLTSGTYVYIPGVYVGLAIKWTISDTGSFELRVNGGTTPDILLSGIDTNTGTTPPPPLEPYVTRITFGWIDPINDTRTYHFDDIVISDTASPLPTWLGDPSLVYLPPVASGDLAQWDIGGTSPAGQDWQNVDDMPPDAGVTLLETAVSGEQHNFEADDLLDTTGQVFAVVGLARLKKESAGTRTVQQTLKLNTTTVSGDIHVLGTSWATHQMVWTTDPEGNPWTGTNVNALKPGVRLSS